MPTWLALHLDVVVGRRVETRAPVHDAVGARVDREVADAGSEGSRELAGELRAAVPGQAAMAEEAGRAERSERAEGEHLDPDQSVDRERVDDRRSDRNDPGHELRPANRERLGERAAAALPDDRDRAARLGEVLEALLEPIDRMAGAGHVEADPRLSRVVAGTSQPSSHGRERRVPGHEPGDQQHRLPAAVGDRPRRGRSGRAGAWLPRPPGAPRARSGVGRVRMGNPS